MKIHNYVNEYDAACSKFIAVDKARKEFIIAVKEQYGRDWEVQDKKFHNLNLDKCKEIALEYILYGEKTKGYNWNIKLDKDLKLFYSDELKINPGLIYIEGKDKCDREYLFNKDLWQKKVKHEGVDIGYKEWKAQVMAMDVYSQLLELYNSNVKKYFLAKFKLPELFKHTFIVFFEIKAPSSPLYGDSYF